MSIVSAVAYPELEDEQGVSVCVPGAYVKGIDTDGDGTEENRIRQLTKTEKHIIQVMHLQPLLIRKMPQDS